MSLGEWPPEWSLFVLLLSRSDPEEPRPEEREGGGGGSRAVASPWLGRVGLLEEEEE